MRGKVEKHLPVLRKQIEGSGYPAIRKCLLTGKTKFLSRKDRFQALQILDVEHNYKEK